MKPASVLETALYVDDLARAESFYGGTLGLELITKVDGRHAFFRCGAGVLLLFNAEATRIPFNDPSMPVPTHGSTGAGHVCFRASFEEMDDWKAHLGRNGVAIEADFLWPNGARSIYFRDPAGNSLEFGEPKIWGLA
jgi:catechol 2,3-dioxygenase-like lactoylglutathione lyase family enzyme